MMFSHVQSLSWSDQEQGLFLKYEHTDEQRDFRA